MASSSLALFLALRPTLRHPLLVVHSATNHLSISMMMIYISVKRREVEMTRSGWCTRMDEDPQGKGMSARWQVTST